GQIDGSASLFDFHGLRNFHIPARFQPDSGTGAGRPDRVFGDLATDHAFREGAASQSTRIQSGVADPEGTVFVVVDLCFTRGHDERRISESDGGSACAQNHYDRSNANDSRRLEAAQWNSAESGFNRIRSVD